MIHHVASISPFEFRVSHGERLHPEEEDRTRMVRKIKQGGRYLPLKLPHGTLISHNWTYEHIDMVQDVEARYKQAICGAKKRNAEERFDLEKDPTEIVCKKQAGAHTDHPGEGRCKFHDGPGNAVKHGRTSMIRNRNIAMKIEDFINEDSKVMDISQAVITTWASLDQALGEDGEIDDERAQFIAQTMTRIATMIKQHHDITEGQKLVIEVPQFMEWAEVLYSLAIKHILASGGNVSGFLREAQQYYTGAIGQVIGGDGTPSLGTGSADEAEDVLRPGE